jgi:4-hydroxy-3-polyprenylbenzoate decarboxylase
MKRVLVIGLTGASGAIYAVRLIGTLLEAGHELHLCVSPSAAMVLMTELDISLDVTNDAQPLDPAMLLNPPPDSPSAERITQLLGERPKIDVSQGRIFQHHYQNMMAPIASGSCLTDGMVVCPCSGGTVSAIAHGTSRNLIHRAADVHLKERRPLILVPRETPLSTIQLENMRRCAEAGAVMLPAMPGWYHGVTHLSDLVDFVVARICDQLGVEHHLMRRWGGDPS